VSGVHFLLRPRFAGIAGQNKSARRINNKKWPSDSGRGRHFCVRRTHHIYQLVGLRSARISVRAFVILGQDFKEGGKKHIVRVNFRQNDFPKK
jgi:hypothetical protein